MVIDDSVGYLPVLLPRAPGLTDMLLAPSNTYISTGELGEFHQNFHRDVQAALGMAGSARKSGSLLGVVSAQRAGSSSGTPYIGKVIRIDPYRLRSQLVARYSDEEAFEFSADKSRRAIGLEAVALCLEAG